MLTQSTCCKVQTYSLVYPLLAFACLTSNCMGQNEENTKAKNVQYTLEELETFAPDMMQMLNDVVKVDIDSSNQTVKTFIESIQKQCPVHLNFVIMDDAQNINLPQIKLSKVSAAAAINALSLATNRQIMLDYDDSGQIGVIRRVPQAVRPMQVSVLNVSDVLSTHTNESVLSSIEIGLEMIGGDDKKIQLKLHEQTKLLFVKGSHEEIDMVEQVIAQLNASLNSSRRNRGGFGAGGNGAALHGGPLGPGSGGMSGSGGSNKTRRGNR